MKDGEGALGEAEKWGFGALQFPKTQSQFPKTAFPGSLPTPPRALRAQWTLSSDRLFLSDHFRIPPNPCLDNRFPGDSSSSSVQRPWQTWAPPRRAASSCSPVPGWERPRYLHSPSRQTFRLVFREPGARMTLLGNHGGGLCNCPRRRSAELPACAAARRTHGHPSPPRRCRACPPRPSSG